MVHYIGIAGTHSTGKSTFLDALRERLEQLGLRVGAVADKATNCRDAGFKILQDHTFESTLWITASVIQAELEAGRTANVVLVDRPVPDAIGYLEAALEVQQRRISIADRDYLYTIARLHGSRYSLLLKTRLDPAIPFGLGRDPDLSFRELVDKKITGSLQTLGLSYHILDPSGTNDALELVLRTIGVP
jgi:thymidylate kinase